MSSPISSLKKNKRSPLHSPSKPTQSTDHFSPFRHPDFSEDQLQTLTENSRSVRFIKGLKPFRQPDSGVTFLENLSAISRSDEKLSATPRRDSTLLTATEHELMSLLMSRLVQVENRLVETQRQVYEKDKKMHMLVERVKIYEKARDETVTTSTDLENRCIKLQQQVHDMEKFLSDYGMVWVGDKRHTVPLIQTEDTSDIIENRVAAERSWIQGGSTSAREFVMDYDLVLENIGVLNTLVGISEMDSFTGTAQFARSEPIPLTLFANGIMLFSGPFRSLMEPSTQQFVQDLMDGFYPTELQALYPEGISFRVYDNRDVLYRPQPLPFHGEGSSVSEHPQNKTKQFLKKLPRVVVREGQVINIRDTVSNMLHEEPCTKPQEIKVIPSPVTDSGEKLKSSLLGDMATLRIKSENGSEVYLLKLYTKHKILELRHYLDTFRPDYPSNYRIISLCPYEEYDNLDATLEECGIVHSVALYLRTPSKTKMSFSSNSMST